MSYYLKITPYLETANGNNIRMAETVYEIPEEYVGAPGIDFPRCDVTILPSSLLFMPVANSAWNGNRIAFRCEVSNEAMPRPTTPQVLHLNEGSEHEQE